METRWGGAGGQKHGEGTTGICLPLLERAMATWGSHEAVASCKRKEPFSCGHSSCERRVDTNASDQPRNATGAPASCNTAIDSLGRSNERWNSTATTLRCSVYRGTDEEVEPGP